jgi:hypothetical protein
MKKFTITEFVNKNPSAFYWRILLPIQTLLLLAYSAPLYGFNTLVGPINLIFAPNDPNDSMMGVLAGSFMFLGAGFGALYYYKLQQWARTPARLLIYLHMAAFITFGLGSLACEMRNATLLFLGFALPSGLIFSNIFSLAMRQLIGWANHFEKAGLQSGVTGLVFGLWGAAFSLYGAEFNSKLGLPTFLLATGSFILLAGIISTLLYYDPPSAGIKSEQSPVPSQNEIALSIPTILRLLPYQLFFVFFVLFQIPGFGFKVVVQQFSDNVFNTNIQTSSIMAVAFLLSYGLSRLVFGLLSDRFQTRSLYLWFILVQASSLLVSAITLPSNQSIVFFTTLMCLIGSSFAAGKSLWVLLQLKLYGPNNFNSAVRATLPALGLAGLLGPITLNFALAKVDMITAMQVWFYSMSAALAVCFVLMLMLKKVDYKKVASNEPQTLSICITGTNPLNKF